MINWNEVVVGETEIVDHAHMRFIVAGLFKKSVWFIQDYDKYSIIRDREDLVGWTIYDPLEEIADQVTLEPIRVSICGHGDAEYVVFVGCYKGKRLLWTDPNISFDGRRVWTRKEG